MAAARMFSAVYRVTCPSVLHLTDFLWLVTMGGEIHMCKNYSPILYSEFGALGRSLWSDLET